MSNTRIAYGDGSMIGVGDWVTNDEPMLGEPHEIVAVDDFHWVCCESAGHVVRIPWSDPTLKRSAKSSASYEGEQK